MNFRFDQEIYDTVSSSLQLDQEDPETGCFDIVINYADLPEGCEMIDEWCR